MQQTKTKYNSDTIGVVCNNEELEVIGEYQKQLEWLPTHIQEDLALWISHIVEKYWFSYIDVFGLSKVEIWQMILHQINSFNGLNSKEMS